MLNLSVFSLIHVPDVRTCEVTTRVETPEYQVPSSPCLRLFWVKNALPEKLLAELLLCATSVFSVPLWLFLRAIVNHEDTENTEVAHRKARLTVLREKPGYDCD